MNRRALALSIAMIAVSGAAGAVVYGGSNFGRFDYPAQDCGLPPYAPERPFDLNSVREVDAYNARVDQYNTQLRSFSECINSYVERAEKDMQRIREKANAAVEDMRRLNMQATIRR